MRKYILQHKFMTGATAILLIINSFFQVYATTQMTAVANSLIEGNQQAFLNSLLFVLLLWGITFVIGYFQSIIQESTIQKMSKSIRLDLASQIEKMEMSKLNRTEIDKYKSFMQNDINIIEDKGFKSLFFITRFLANGLFSLAALLFYNVSLFALALVLLVILNSLPKALRKLTREANENVSIANNKFLALMQDVINGYETLKMFNAEKKFVQSIDNGSNIISDAKVNYSRKQALINVIVGVMNIFSQIAVIFTTGLLVFKGAISVGAILSTTEISTKIFDSFGIVNQYYILLDSVSPLFKILNDDLKVEGTLAKVTEFEKIDIKDLSFAYSDAQKTIFEDFNYTFKKGKKYHIVGSSGAGKSTLLKLIFKQLVPIEGGIYLNNKPYIESDIVFVSQYLKQDTHIFDFDLDENIVLGRDVDAKNLQNVKKSLGIEKLDARNLSGGEKQLVSLARVLVSPKDLIILDESFSNIDLDKAKNIMKHLMETGSTIITVSHREDEIRDFELEKILV